MTGKIEKKLISCLVFILCALSLAENRRDLSPLEPDFLGQDQFGSQNGFNPFQNLSEKQLQRFNELFSRKMSEARGTLNNLDPESRQQLQDKIFEDALTQAKKPRENERDGGGAGGGGTPGGGSSQPFGLGAAQAIAGAAPAVAAGLFANSQQQIAAIRANRDKKIAETNADVAKRQTDGAVKMFDNALKADQTMQRIQLDSKLKQKEMDSGMLSRAMAQQFALQSKSQANKMQSDLIDLKYKASLSALQAKIQSDDSQVLQTLLNLRGLRNRPMGSGNGLMVTNTGGGNFYPLTNPLFRSNLSYASQNRFVLGSNRTDRVKNANSVFAATPATAARGISAFHVNQPSKTGNSGITADQAHTNLR